MRNRFSRRDVLKGSGALALGLSSTTKVLSAAPPATAVTPALIEAAKKEGKVVYYTSVDLPLAEKIAKAFEAKYPGVAVRVERTGAERVFQRIGQEYGSRIHAVDVVNSSDASHFIVWKRDGILQPYVPEDVAKFYPTDHKEADGLYASFRIGLCIIAYNTNLVKKEDAPKSFADLLDPKWTGKILKAHPGYSGTIMTATFEMQRDLGWDYLEKLAKQKVMQLQSSADPPKKLALGERAVQADGNEYNIFQIKEIRRPGRAGLCDRGHAAGGRAERHLQGCAQSERGAAVPVVLLLRRMPAAHLRCRRPALDASAGQGEGRPHAVQRDQDHEGRRSRRRKNERGDQGPLRQDLQGVRTGPMQKSKFSRRDILKGSTALAIGTVFAEPVRAAAPPAEAITPALIEAAKKEGKCSFYTAMDLQFAEKLGKEFEAKYPGIAVRVERSGAERVFTRIGQEYSSNVHAVDVVNTADQSHCLAGFATAGSLRICRKR